MFVEILMFVRIHLSIFTSHVLSKSCANKCIVILGNERRVAGSISDMRSVLFIQYNYLRCDGEWRCEEVGQ